MKKLLLLSLVSFSISYLCASPGNARFGTAAQALINPASRSEAWVLFQQTLNKFRPQGPSMIQLLKSTPKDYTPEELAIIIAASSAVCFGRLLPIAWRGFAPGPKHEHITTLQANDPIFNGEPYHEFMDIFPPAIRMSVVDLLPVEENHYPNQISKIYRKLRGINDSFSETGSSVFHFLLTKARNKQLHMPFFDVLELTTDSQVADCLMHDKKIRLEKTGMSLDEKEQLKKQLLNDRKSMDVVSFLRKYQYI